MRDRWGWGVGFEVQVSEFRVRGSRIRVESVDERVYIWCIFKELIRAYKPLGLNRDYTRV